MHSLLSTLKDAATSPNYEHLFYLALGLAFILYCIGIIVGSKAARDSKNE